MSSSSSILAICNGPIVTTWDCNQSISTIGSTSITTSSSSSSAKELLDLGIIRQFRPHGDDNDVLVSDLTWNHNGNVLATCSNASWCQVEEEDDKANVNHNVILSNAKTGGRLDSFSNFLSTGKLNSKNQPKKSAATSISFEGTGGKSRYLCLADEGGTISIWDMKKNSRARCFRLGSNRSISSLSSNYNSPSSKVNNSNVQHSCSKAFIDPTDKFVAGLSSYDGSLHLYYLRQGKLASIFHHKTDQQKVVGAKACQFSSLNTNQVVVGNNDGSLLVWDVNNNNTGSSSTIGTPLSYLPNVHEQSVTDAAYSPTNARLIASASLGGNVIFHDVHMRQPIQTIPVSLTSGITSIAFHSNNATHFAAGTTNGAVTLYDLRNATKSLHTLHLSPHSINRLQFSPYHVLSSSKSTTNTITTTAHTPSHSENSKQSKKLTIPDSYKRNNKLEIPHPKNNENSAQIPVSGGAIGNTKTMNKKMDATPQMEATPHKTIISQSYSHSTKSFKSSAEKIVNSMKVGSEKMISSVIPKKSSGSDEPASGGRYKGPSPFVSLKSKIISNNQDDSSNLVKNLFQKNSSPTKNDSNNIPISPKQKEEGKTRFLNYDSKKVNSTTKIINNDTAKPIVSSISLHSSLAYDDKEHSTKKEEEKNYHNTIKSYDEESTYKPDNVVHSTNFNDVNKKMSTPSGSQQNANRRTDGVSNILMMSKQDLDDAIDDSMEYLREDFDSSIRNLHLDLLRQFQQQSDEMTALFAKQQVMLEQVLEENRFLRNENMKLRDRN